MASTPDCSARTYCQWLRWEFNVCTGCSVDPPGNDIGTYETLIEDGRIFIKPHAIGRRRLPEADGDKSLRGMMKEAVR